VNRSPGSLGRDSRHFAKGKEVYGGAENRKKVYDDTTFVQAGKKVIGKQGMGEVPKLEWKGWDEGPLSGRGKTGVNGYRRGK